MNDIVINKAEINDVPELVKLVNKAYRGDESRKGWTTEADLLEGLRIDEAELTRIMNAEDSAIFKATINDDITGCVYLKEQDDEMYLGMLTVDPSLQDKGTGKTLMQFAEEHSKQQHKQAIAMTVISVRTELINWYIRKGYQLTGEIKPFPNNTQFGEPKMPLEFVVLKKQL
jgi:ribosomal protein S18 acetylase RimI-like enzyme